MAERSRKAGWVALGVLIVNQLLAGVGVASGIAVGGLLAQQLTGVTALAGIAQTASVLGAGIVAIPLARLATRVGRHWALAAGYLLAFTGAVLVVAAAATGAIPLLFLGMAAFGAGSAAGLQARFAATEIAAPGYEARSMSLVLWATTIGVVAGPNLSQIGSDFGETIGLPPLVGPFLFSAAAFAAATLLAAVLLRTPPAGVLEADAAASAGLGAAPRSVGTIEALRIALRSPTAVFAMTAIVVSQTVMVGVMVMTPVNLHDHGISLGLIGIVLSIHVIGMYGASPLMGWLADRIGAPRVIVVGIVILFIATIIGMVFPGDDMVAVPLALGLLGLGWSAGLIGGSTLLTRAVDAHVRVPLQGATDAAMNIAAAASSALSGIVLGWGGFAAVNVIAAGVLCLLVAAGVRARWASRRATVVVD